MALFSETLRTYLVHLRCIGIEPMAVSLRTSEEDIRPLPIFSHASEKFMREVDFEADVIFANTYKAIGENRHTEGSLERQGSEAKPAIDYKNLLIKYIGHMVQLNDDAGIELVRLKSHPRKRLPVFTSEEEEILKGLSDQAFESYPDL